MSDTEVPSWVVHGRRTVYDGAPWVRVELADVTAPHGQRWEHHVVHIQPAAIAVIADESAGTVLMKRRHRWVVDTIGYELLGGLVEHGEDPAEAARREVVEESGWLPRGEPEYLGGFEALPGVIAGGGVELYLWRHADYLGTPTDPEEAGELVWFPLWEALDLARRRQLLGAATAAALALYAAVSPA